MVARRIPILAREPVAAIQAAPGAPTMLDLHAHHHARGIGERAAPILWVVEQAAATHADIARVWAQNNGNRRTGDQLWPDARTLSARVPTLSRGLQSHWVQIDEVHLQQVGQQPIAGAVHHSFAAITCSKRCAVAVLTAAFPAEDAARERVDKLFGRS